MADPNTPVQVINTVTPPPAPPVVAPVVEAPKVEATSVVTPAPAVVEAPKVEGTILGDALVQQPTQTPSPASSDGISQTAEPAKTPADTTQGITEGNQSVEPAPLPTYEPFKLPDGVTVQQERLTEFTNILSDLEVKGKTEHALVQEFGQKAVDFHIAELKRSTEALTKAYQTAWENQKVAWKEQFLKDPELGGNRFQTTVDAALSVIRNHGGTAEHQKEFRNLMETSGLGNHPVMIRFLANLGTVMKEGSPLAAQKPAPQEVKSRAQKLYGNLR